MKRLSPLATSLALTALTSAAVAAPASQVVSFMVNGHKVVGTLALPGDVDKPPVVLLLHGFTGSRNELATPSVPEGIFARAAKAWADQGLASFRIDFRGHGDSEGRFDETTLTRQAQDALAAINYLQSLGTVDTKRLSVVGWSQGGAVATMVAAQSPLPPRAVALWAPVAVPSTTFNGFLGADFVARGLASGGAAVSTTLPWGAKVSLKTAFFEDLYKVSPVTELSRYPGPVWVAVGTKDPVVTPQPAMGQLLLRYHSGPHELWVRPMDHAFNAFEGAATLDEMVAATSTFLWRYLK